MKRWKDATLADYEAGRVTNIVTFSLLLIIRVRLIGGAIQFNSY